METKTWGEYCWLGVEKAFMPILLFAAVLFFFGRPLIVSYQMALAAQTALAVESTETLRNIKTLIAQEAEEQKAARLAAIERLLAVQDDERAKIKKQSLLVMAEMAQILSELKATRNGKPMEPK